MRFGLFRFCVLHTKAVQFGMSRPHPLSRIPCNAWLLLIGVPLAVFWTRLFPTDQMQNIAVGRQHAGVIKQQIQSDPRFASIIVDVWTGGGGEMTARGKLASKAEMETLIDIIEASHPPVSLSGWFEIGGQEHQIRLPAATNTAKQ